MMTKQYKQLKRETKKIDKNVKKLQDILFELLSVEAKDLTIGFGDQTFQFCAPDDLTDQEQMNLKKCQLITLILRDAFDSYFDEKSDDKVWGNAFALAMGENPIEHQQQRIDLQASYEVNEGIRQESGVKALPLNEESYQVAQEIKKNLQDTIEDLELKFDVETEQEIKNDKAWPEDKKKKKKKR